MTDSKKPRSTSAEREALMKEISAVAVAIGNVPAPKNRPMAKGAKLGVSTLGGRGYTKEEPPEPPSCVAALPLGS